MVQLDYVGSRGRNLPVRRDINGLPREFVSFSRSRDAAWESYLSASVPNPFAGLVPNTTLNGTTTTRFQLLRPYPQFLNVALMEYDGSDSYDSGQLSVSKRFKGGLSVLATYTQSKATEKVSYLNSFDTALEERTSPDDRPRRATLGATVPIPVGKGRKWGNGWGKVMNAIFGGWNLSASYQYQQGFPMNSTTNGIPIGWGNVYFDPACNWNDLSVRSVGSRDDNGQIIGVQTPAWDTSCFYFHDAAVQTNGVDDPAKQRSDPRINMGNGARYFPSILDNMRMPNLHLLDFGLSKWFDFGKDVQLQIRIDAINAINYTVWWNPGLDPRNANFGKFQTTRNSPRDIQLGGRLTF
jgi:hypothetical protein